MKKNVNFGRVAKISAACAVIVMLGLTGCNDKKQAAAKAEDKAIRIEGAFRGEEEARF